MMAIKQTSGKLGQGMVLSLDLPGIPKRPGRPKTSTFSRKEQLRRAAKTYRKNKASIDDASSKIVRTETETKPVYCCLYAVRAAVHLATIYPPRHWVRAVYFRAEPSC